MLQLSRYKFEKDLEFDAKDASSLLFTSYGEEKKRVHRKMLHARKVTSGAQREGRASPVTGIVYLNFTFICTSLS